MSTRNNRKQSLYFPAEMLAEIKREAERTDRSVSWIVQYAWAHGHKVVAALPAVDNPCRKQRVKSVPLPACVPFVSDEATA